MALVHHVQFSVLRLPLAHEIETQTLDSTIFLWRS